MKSREELQQSIDKLNKDQKVIESKVYRLKKQIAIIDCPYEIGNVLINSKGIQAKIADIVPGRAQSYKMIIRKIKIDGSNYSQLTEAYGYDHWELLR